MVFCSDSLRSLYVLTRGGCRSRCLEKGARRAYRDKAVERPVQQGAEVGSARINRPALFDFCRCREVGRICLLSVRKNYPARSSKSSREAMPLERDRDCCRFPTFPKNPGRCGEADSRRRSDMIPPETASWRTWPPCRGRSLDASGGNPQTPLLTCRVKYFEDVDPPGQQGRRLTYWRSSSFTKRNHRKQYLLHSLHLRDQLWRDIWRRPFRHPLPKDLSNRPIWPAFFSVCADASPHPIPAISHGEPRPDCRALSTPA